MSLSKCFRDGKLAKRQQDSEVPQYQNQSRFISKPLSSPVPSCKQTNPISKVQRLKNRLAGSSKSNSITTAPSSDQTTKEADQAHSVSTSASSSSGFSSSLSLIEEEGANRQTSVKELEISAPQAATRKLITARDEVGQAQVQQKNPILFPGNDKSLIMNEEYYQLCQCIHCRRSGQQIFSPTNLHSKPPVTFRPPTPPKLAPRKAVCFRNSVERIGALGECSQVPLICKDPWYLPTNNVHDSCDSLHATRDHSMDEVAQSEKNNLLVSGPWMRPFNSSTPKPGFSEKLVRAEIHQAPMEHLNNHNSQSSQNLPAPTDYTCLCSPDFICVHNYPELANSSYQSAADNPNTINVKQNEPMSNIQVPSDFLERDNLSTYVNLSNIYNHQPSQRIQSWPQQSLGQPIEQSMRGTQIDSMYGNLWNPNNKDTSLVNNRQVLTNLLAKELEQTMAECHLCNAPWQTSMTTNPQVQINQELDQTQISDVCFNQDQISKSGNHQQMVSYEGQTNHSQEKPCSCGPQRMLPANTSNANLTGSWDISSSSKSFHTANSNSLIALQNPSELSVLPIDSSHNNDYKVLPIRNEFPASNKNLNTEGMKQRHQQDCNNTSSNQNCVDSSLSSLFVYRHQSDDNQPPEEFDPDSLEIIQPFNESKTRPERSQTLQNNSKSTNWLKARPKSEYITLSSASNSVASIQGNRGVRVAVQPSESRLKVPGQTQVKWTNKSANSTIRVDPDISHSSIAKRRHLTQQQQKQQQQQQLQDTNQQQLHLQQQANSRSNKTAKLSASRSTPNLTAGGAKGKSPRSSLKKGIKTNGSTSNVKSIYQCVKNHLLDITKSSSSNSSVPSFKTQSTSLAETTVGSSASLPKNISGLSVQSSTIKKLSGRKAQAQVCIPF